MREAVSVASYIGFTELNDYPCDPLCGCGTVILSYSVGGGVVVTTCPKCNATWTASEIVRFYWRGHE